MHVTRNIYTMCEVSRLSFLELHRCIGQTDRQTDGQIATSNDLHNKS